MITIDSKTFTKEDAAVKNSPELTFEHPARPLKIYTLGRFGLVGADEPIHFSGKVPRKPLELLKALVAFGGRGVSEELLIDHLWQGAESGSAINSFSVALHRLRRLLGGNNFILRQNGQVTLDPEFCWVDAWTFERLSKQAVSAMNEGDTDTEAALQMAQQAIAHYTGPFLPADSDRQWSISMRERLRGKMRTLILTVGQHWEAASDWQTAIAIYQKGLETDDLYDEFYQRQMICHCLLGNYGEIASVYKRCRITLAKLGIKPSPQTTSVYESVIPAT